MHTRRLATLLLGAWLAGTGFMMLVATHNLRAVDALFRQMPDQIAARVNILGQDRIRVLYRHQAAELNAWYFAAWEWAQFPIVLGAAGALYASRRRDWTMALLLSMAALLLFQRGFLTPKMAELSRRTVFAREDRSSTERVAFGRMHAAYSGIEVIKIGMALSVSIALLFKFSPPPAEAPRPVAKRRHRRQR